MIEALNNKYFLTLPPQSINGTDTDSTEIDCKGYNYLTVVFLYGASTADMDNLSLKSASAAGGSYSVYSGSAMDVPTATDDNKVWVWNINLGGKNRFWKVRCDPGAAATLVGAVAILSRGDQAPNTDAERGVDQSITIA
jgi:hypothetical protein